MSVKWSKSYPEAADRFAVSIADENSPTGFSWASKTIAEVKSLLGIDTRFKTYYKALLTLSGTDAPTIETEYINLLGESPVPSYVNTGRYKLTFTSLTDIVLPEHNAFWYKIIDFDDFSFCNLQWGLASNYVQTTIKTDEYAYKNPVEAEILIEIGKYE